MLLRVDVYPHDWKPPPPEAVQDDHASLPPASQTLYACLASASTSSSSSSTGQDDGRILSIGRKTGDILFSSDKSVSREHIIVRLASINKTHQQQQASPAKKKTSAVARAANRNNNPSSVVSDDEEDESSGVKNKTIPRPLLATTPEQIQACQADQDYQMCVLMENVGKLGTFLVLQEHDDSNDAGKKKRRDDSDSATGDDETDDEDQHPSQLSLTPAAAGVPLSTATQYLLRQPKGKNKSATLKPIALQETVVLHDLANRHGRVIVQCGKLGSTLVFTRHAIQIVRSGSKQGAAQWRAHDYQLGLVLDKENCFDEETNLMVTPARNSSPKQLAAWCRNIPIVNKDYLQALLWQRSSPQDPLFPNVESFAPRPDTYHFWTQVRPDPQLWSSCTLMSTKAKDDLEWLARSAGAKIVALYDEEYATLDTQALVAALQKRHGVHPDQVSKTCFGIATSRHSKLTKHLLEAFPELPMIPANQVAKCITEQRLLQDPNGNVIGMVEAVVETRTESNNARQEKQQQSQQDGKPGTAAAQDSSATSQQAAEESTKTTKQIQDDVVSNDKQDKRSRPREETQATTEDLPPEPDQDNLAHENPPSNQETAVSQSKEQTSDESRKKRAASPQDDGNAENTLPSKRQKLVKNRPAPSNQETAVSQSKEQTSDESRKKRAAPPPDEGNAENTVPNKKQKLVESKNRPGWFQAAPNNATQRRAYQKSREEIIQATGHDELNDVAVTEESQGLVVAMAGSLTAVRSNQQKRKRSGPDFRKFRKNSVVVGTVSPIVMRSVLPKETEEQMHFEEQQHALEEQRRRADELFRDPGPRGSKSRGRRR